MLDLPRLVLHVGLPGHPRSDIVRASRREASRRVLLRDPVVCEVH